jgi:4-aminobutyrate aminotransferase-like enzyme
VMNVENLNTEVLARGRAALLAGWSTTSAGEPNLLLTRAEGTRIWDATGREYLDFTSQAWSNNVGAGHPKVVTAAIEQARQITHVRSNYDSIPLLELSDRMVQLAPEGLTKIGYCLHGSLAVEMAMKIAIKNRPGASLPLSLYNGYHGRSLATLAASWPHTHDQFHRLMPPIVRVPQPDPYRPPKGVRSEDLAEHYADLLRDAIKRGVNGTPAAFIMEPIQGNGGHIEFPRDYYRMVREICDEEGVLLIWDEIQTGLGRIGTWWATDYYGVVPDILIFGKGIGGGFPLAGISIPQTTR